MTIKLLGQLNGCDGSPVGCGDAVVTCEQYTADMTAVNAALADTVNNDDLGNYVTTTAFNASQQTQDMAIAAKASTADLGNYVTTTAFNASQQTQDMAIAAKASTADLGNYVTTADFNASQQAQDTLIAAGLGDTGIALAGKADLVGGKVPASQLPSYVDDVVEASNLGAFPATGESGKIYVAADTNTPYRWSGSTYVAVASDKQTLGISGQTLSITGGNSVTLPTIDLSSYATAASVNASQQAQDNQIAAKAVIARVNNFDGLPATGDDKTLYITSDTDKLYIWDTLVSPNVYVEVSPGTASAGQTLTASTTAISSATLSTTTAGSGGTISLYRYDVRGADTAALNTSDMSNDFIVPAGSYLAVTMSITKSRLNYVLDPGRLFALAARLRVYVTGAAVPTTGGFYAVISGMGSYDNHGQYIAKNTSDRYNFNFSAPVSGPTQPTSTVDITFYAFNRTDVTKTVSMGTSIDGSYIAFSPTDQVGSFTPVQVSAVVAVGSPPYGSYPTCVSL